MTKIEENQDQEWITAAKLKGPIPFIEPNQSQDGTTWSSPPANSFMVRGPHYFKTKTKIPAKDYLTKPLAFDWIKGDSKISNILNNYPKHRVRRAIEAASQSGHKPFVFAFNFQLPTKDHNSIVGYFLAHEPLHTGNFLTTRFLNGDDSFRNSRLKLIFNIVRGPWIVTKAVGEQAIALIGRSLKCTYHCSEDSNSMEVDIDVGSSMVASALCHFSFRYFKNLTMEMGFVIEGQDESELPEQVLGAFRFSGLDESLAARVVDV